MAKQQKMMKKHILEEYNMIAQKLILNQKEHERGVKNKYDKIINQIIDKQQNVEKWYNKTKKEMFVSYNETIHQIIERQRTLERLEHFILILSAIITFIFIITLKLGIIGKYNKLKAVFSTTMVPVAR